MAALQCECEDDKLNVKCEGKALLQVTQEYDLQLLSPQPPIHPRILKIILSTIEYFYYKVCYSLPP